MAGPRLVTSTSTLSTAPPSKTLTQSQVSLEYPRGFGLRWRSEAPTPLSNEKAPFTDPKSI
jgi:hypothetical protein